MNLKTDRCEEFGALSAISLTRSDDDNMFTKTKCNEARGCINNVVRGGTILVCERPATTRDVTLNRGLWPGDRDCPMKTTQPGWLVRCYDVTTTFGATTHRPVVAEQVERQR